MLFSVINYLLILVLVTNTINNSNSVRQSVYPNIFNEVSDFNDIVEKEYENDPGYQLKENEKSLKENNYRDAKFEDNLSVGSVFSTSIRSKISSLKNNLNPKHDIRYRESLPKPDIQNPGDKPTIHMVRFLPKQESTGREPFTDKEVGTQSENTNIPDYVYDFDNAKEDKSCANLKKIKGLLPIPLLESILINKLLESRDESKPYPIKYIINAVLPNVQEVPELDEPGTQQCLRSYLKRRKRQLEYLRERRANKHKHHRKTKKAQNNRYKSKYHGGKSPYRHPRNVNGNLDAKLNGMIDYIAKNQTFNDTLTYMPLVFGTVSPADSQMLLAGVKHNASTEERIMLEKILSWKSGHVPTVEGISMTPATIQQVTNVNHPTQNNLGVNNPGTSTGSSAVILEVASLKADATTLDGNKYNLNLNLNSPAVKKSIIEIMERQQNVQASEASSSKAKRQLTPQVASSSAVPTLANALSSVCPISTATAAPTSSAQLGFIVTTPAAIDEENMIPGILIYPKNVKQCKRSALNLPVSEVTLNDLLNSIDINKIIKDAYTPPSVDLDDIFGSPKSKKQCKSDKCDDETNNILEILRNINKESLTETEETTTSSTLSNIFFEEKPNLKYKNPEYMEARERLLKLKNDLRMVKEIQNIFDQVASIRKPEQNHYKGKRAAPMGKKSFIPIISQTDSNRYDPIMKGLINVRIWQKSHREPINKLTMSKVQRNDPQQLLKPTSKIKREDNHEDDNDEGTSKDMQNMNFENQNLISEMIANATTYFIKQDMNEFKKTTTAELRPFEKEKLFSKADELLKKETSCLTTSTVQVPDFISELLNGDSVGDSTDGRDSINDDAFNQEEASINDEEIEAKVSALIETETEGNHDREVAQMFSIADELMNDWSDATIMDQEREKQKNANKTISKAPQDKMCEINTDRPRREGSTYSYQRFDWGPHRKRKSKKTSLNLHRTPPLRTTIPHNITIEINQTNEENYGWIQKTINYKSHVEDLKYICDHCQFHIESTVKQDLTKQTHFTKNETKNEHRQENGNNEIFNKETVTSHNYVEQVNISDIVLEPIIRETTLEQSNENSFNRDISQLHSGIVSDFDHDLSTSVSVKENTIKEKVQSNENHTEVISENEQSTKVDISSEKSNKHSAETLADYNAKTFESTTEEENGDLTTSKTSQTNNEVQENEELNTEKEGKGTSLNKEVENVTDKKISETTEFRKTSNTHKTTEVNFERYNEPEKSEKISTNAQKPSTKGTITLKNEEYQVTTNTMKKTELEKNEDTGKGSQGVLLTEAENEERTTSRIVTKPKVNNIFQNNTMTEGNTEEEMSITNSGFLETERSSIKSKVEHKTSKTSTQNEISESYKIEKGNLEKNTKSKYEKSSFSQIFLTEISKHKIATEVPDEYFTITEESLSATVSTNNIIEKPKHEETTVKHEMSLTKSEFLQTKISSFESKFEHKTSESSTENKLIERYQTEEGNLEKSTMEPRVERKTSEGKKSTVEARLEHKISESTTKNESSESYKTEEGNLGKTTKARYEKSSITYIFLTEESKNRITTEETDEYFTITEKNLPANTATNNIIEKPEHKKITVIHETSSKMFTTESEESDKDNSKKGSSKQKNAENIEEHSTMAQAKYEFSTNEMNTLSEQQKGSDYRYSSFEEMEKDAIEYKTDARENQEFGHSETLPPNTASTVHEKGETIFVSNKPTKNTNIKSSFYTSTYHVDATYGHKNTLFPKTTVNKEILHDYDKYLCNPCPTKSKNYAAQGSVALKNKPHEMEPESSQYFTHIASSSKNLNIKENDDVNLQPDVLETIIRKVQPTKNIESLSQSSTPKNAETPEIDQELPAVSTFTTKISVFTRNDEDLYLQPEIENEARQHTHPNKMFSSTNKCPLSKNEKESEDEYEYVSIASDIEEQTQEGPILLNNKQGSTILSQYLTRLNEENIHEVIEGSHFKFTSTLPTEGTSFLKESGKKVTKYRNGATRKYWNTKNLLETASEEVAPTVIHYVYINCTKSEDAPLKSPGLFAKNGKNQHADSVNMEKNIHHQSIHNDGEQITEHNKEKETFTHETKKNKYKKPSSDISITDIETEIDSFESSNSLSEKTNTPAEIIGFSTVEEANENEIKYESTVEERHTIDISLNQSHKEDQYTKNSETIIHTLTEVENITQKNGSTSNLENEEMNENESENIEEENGTYDTETGVMNVTEPSIHLSDTENLNVEENNKTIAETAIYTKDIENVSENVEITERNEHESKNVEEEEDSNVETDSEMTDSVEISSFHHTKIQNLNHTVKEETLSNKPEIESNSKMEKSEANTTEQKNGNIEQEGTISEYIELKSMNLMESTSFDHSKTSHKNKENNEERSHHSTEEMINTQEIENESVTEEQASTNKKKSKNAEPANSLNKISDNQKTEMPIEEQYQTTKEEVERSPHSRIQEEEMTSEYSKEENEISERNVLIPESNTNQKVDFSYTLTARTKIEISEEKTSEPFDYSLSEPARVLIEEIESEKKLETKSGESELEFETQSELTDLFSIFEYATFQTTASNFHKNTFTSPHAEHHQHRLHSKKLITPPSTIEIEPPLEFVDSTICKLCNKSKKHHTTEHMKYTTIVQPKTNNQEEQEEINEITLENMKDTEEGNTTVELEHEEEQEGTESNGENEEEISHEAMKTKKQKQKNEKTTIKTHVTQHQTSTAKETEHTTYMTTTEKSTTKESTKTISTQEAITESVKNTNIEHTESAEKYEEESTSQAEKLAISTKHSKNPKKFSYTHGAVITTTEMISHGVIQKPNVFVIKVSKENEKLSDNIIENIVNSPMTDIIVHYIDLSSNKDKKLPSNPRENVSLGLDIPHQKCKKSEFESGENCFCNINEYIETLINKINKKEEVKAKDNYCETFFKLSKGLVIGLSTGSTKRKRRGLLYMKNEGVGENVHYDSIEGIFESYFHLFSKGSHSYHLPGESAIIHCNNGMFNPQSKSDSTWIWMFHPPNAIKDTLLQEKSEVLTLHDVTSKNVGNYTCSPENSEKKNWHKLEIVTFPTYEVQINIFYTINDSCSLQTGDILYMKLSKIVAPILCSKTNDFCNFDMDRPRCLTREDNNFYNVSMRIKTNQDFILSIKTECDINCKLSIYENVAGIIYKNCDNLQHVPIHLEVEKSYEIDFIPHIDGKQKSAIIVSSPKIAVSCLSGYGLEIKRQRICVLCPSQTFSGENEAFCIRCPAGKYQPEPGSKECIQCNSPVDDKACLRMLYTDTRLFKVYVGVAFGMIVLLIIVVVVWMTGLHDYSQNSINDRYEGSLRHRADLKTKQKDLEKGIRQPLLSKSPREAPPQLPPVDF
ncbi:hypothetical protein ABEB36_003560 [Hypothenemus hampei]|uniref:Ig-like domain-containing protein n=1 Tax=Hypothenemus hampei TaxID=57062 RepID=A0ABD1F9M3_HYPHA